jgi:hypothetical protein
LVNCILSAASGLSGSCKPYRLGFKRTRNSNTFVSASISSCGIRWKIPKGLFLPGFGEPWHYPDDDDF